MKNFNNLQFVLIGFLLVAFWSCQKEPEVSFDVSSSTVTVNEAVTFYNNSTEAESYEWEFGDGNKSTSNSPSHSYSNPGTYTVNLTGFSKNEKKTDSFSRVITVNAADPCEGVTCVNGSCANGSCNCDEGYQGSDCSQQITPTKMVLRKVRITRFPATDNGGGWDLSSGPEIYPLLSKGGSIVWDSPIYYENADPNTVYEFDVNPTIDLTDPSSQYTIEVYDYDDTSSDDWMGGINFTPYFSTTNGFPTTIVLDANGVVAFEIDVSYVW